MWGSEIDKCMANPNMQAKLLRNTLMFSATLDKNIQTKVAEKLKKEKDILTVSLLGGACQDWAQTSLEVGKQEKMKTFMSIGPLYWVPASKEVVVVILQ